MQLHAKCDINESFYIKYKLNSEKIAYLSHNTDACFSETLRSELVSTDQYFLDLYRSTPY